MCVVSYKVTYLTDDQGTFILEPGHFIWGFLETNSFILYFQRNLEMEKSCYSAAWDGLRTVLHLS